MVPHYIGLVVEEARELWVGDIIRALNYLKKIIVGG